MGVREKLVELLREAPYNIFGNKLGNCYIGEWWESEFACDITKQFLWATRLQDQEVTHWMPLPLPPKGE